MKEGAWIVSFAVVDAVTLPEVPVMVIVLDPTGVELAEVSVSVV